MAGFRREVRVRIGFRVEYRWDGLTLSFFQSRVKRFFISQRQILLVAFFTRHANWESANNRNWVLNKSIL